MFYIVSIILLLTGMLAREYAIVIAAGLFSIAGAIEVWGLDKKEKKDESRL